MINTDASLREMVPPAAIVIFTSLLTGILFGVTAVSGLLVGSLVAAVQLAISMSNSGGAWVRRLLCCCVFLFRKSDSYSPFYLLSESIQQDNAKKYIEAASPESELQGKGSDIHKAAVVGDTVGDPFKDTSGPALNIVMKLQAVLALVFADTFFAINAGRGLLKM
jgi:Na+/H+-translocating membrane pyrophosphatase